MSNASISFQDSFNTWVCLLQLQTIVYSVVRSKFSENKTFFNKNLPDISCKNKMNLMTFFLRLEANHHGFYTQTMIICLSYTL